MLSIGGCLLLVRSVARGRASKKNLACLSPRILLLAAQMGFIILIHRVRCGFFFPEPAFHQGFVLRFYLPGLFSYNIDFHVIRKDLVLDILWRKH